MPSAKTFFVRKSYDVKNAHDIRRDKILAKTNGHCWYCGKFLERNWVIEHQDGHKKNKRADSNRLVPACYPCNNKKRNKTMDEFRTLCGGERFYGESAQ